jgi:hypothetical protein
MNQFLNKCRKQNNRLHALKIFQHELKIIHKEAFPRQANAVEIIFGNNFFFKYIKIILRILINYSQDF